MCRLHQHTGAAQYLTLSDKQQLNCPESPSATQLNIPRYQLAIRNRVRWSLVSGPKQLVDVVRDCAGTYPTLVADAIAKLENDVQRERTDAWRLAPIYDGLSNPFDSPLSHIEGNPVLCSWYFTFDSCDRIDSLRDWSRSRIAFLGCPRLFEWFNSRHLGQRCVLLELDAAVTRVLRTHGESPAADVVDYDVSDPIPSELTGQFDCVFFDAPWYPEEYPLWFARAGALAPSGSVIFPLFPELTRPSATQERLQILDGISRAGHEAIMLTRFVDYEVPSFEKSQLDRSGMHDLGSWKVADLVIVQLTGERLPPAQLTRKEPSQEWAEIDIGNIRVFIRGDLPAQDSDSLLALPSGKELVLASPSRRDRGRTLSNVLTSRGHGFVCRSPQQLSSVLKRLSADIQAGTTADMAIDSLSVDDATRSILAGILPTED